MQPTNSITTPNEIVKLFQDAAASKNQRYVFIRIDNNGLKRLEGRENRNQKSSVEDIAIFVKDLMDKTDLNVDQRLEVLSCFSKINKRTSTNSIFQQFINFFKNPENIPRNIINIKGRKLIEEKFEEEQENLNELERVIYGLEDKLEDINDEIKNLIFRIKEEEKYNDVYMVNKLNKQLEILKVKIPELEKEIVVQKKAYLKNRELITADKKNLIKNFF